MLSTTSKSQFVTIPRKEYEEFVELKKVIPIFKTTRSDILDINRGKKEIKNGDYIEWSTLKKENI